MLERLPETPPSAFGRGGDGGGNPTPSRSTVQAGRGRALPYFIAAAVLVPLLLFGVAALRDWRAIEADARDRIVYIRDAVAEHAKRVFATHELVALSVRERLGALDWDAIAASQDLHLYLARVERDFPEVHAIWLVDGEGRLRASSRVMPAPALDLSDRDWFREMRDGGASVVIGPRRTGQIHPDDFFTLSVPRRDPTDAAFDGLIRISITPKYFTDFYASAYPDEGAIALILRSGDILVSYPPALGSPERLPESSPFYRLVGESPSGIVETVGSFDGRERLATYAQLENLPVYVAFGMDVETLSALWRRQVYGYVFFFAPAVAALVLLGVLAWRSHRELEEKVELRTRALSEAVAEKNQLLKEVHHRVKNNMQIVSSLIRMQERVETSPEETIRRVQAMALVHDLIYSHGDFASVNLGAYVRRLGETLVGGVGAGNRVRMSYDLDHVAVTLDRAMPFALILSEVITNAMRHAFPEGEGRIAITLDREGGRAVLRVEDDGAGFDPSARTDGFGLKLIRSLGVQLEADLRWEDGAGTAFVMEFPLETKAEAQPASA